mmetsp:Transcript_10234/g.9895  ORF Transcript_10234/g.9895 Transcript_10234/m.9895 type:complete len:93 (-) Transcript_10234:1051-1329(-)
MMEEETRIQNMKKKKKEARQYDMDHGCSCCDRSFSRGRSRLGPCYYPLNYQQSNTDQRDTSWIYTFTGNSGKQQWKEIGTLHSFFLDIYREL